MSGDNVQQLEATVQGLVRQVAQLQVNTQISRQLQNGDDSTPFDHGDTAWMLTSSALVLFMTMPGLAIYYGGMVRTKVS